MVAWSVPTLRLLAAGPDVGRMREPDTASNQAAAQLRVTVRFLAASCRTQRALTEWQRRQ